MQEDLAQSKMSASAVHTLVELGSAEVGTARELTALLGLEKSSVSRLLKKLQSSGLITTAVDQRDTRSQVLSLTAAGRDSLAEIEVFARRQLLGALHSQPREKVDSIAQGLADFAAALQPQNRVASAVLPSIVSGYRPTVLAQVVALHAAYYSQHYQFGAAFECKVAAEMAEFLGRAEHAKNALFSVYRGDQLLGSISVDGQDLGGDIAHIRWFIVGDGARGAGTGRLLFAAALKFIDESGFAAAHLWTFKGLHAARRLYEQSGFELAEEQLGAQWGVEVSEQKFVRVAGG